MGKKTGPKGPWLEIDWKVFEGLCHVQCTETEIADVLKCHPDTLLRRVKRQYGRNFSDVYSQFKSTGKVSLRKKCYTVAMDGDTQMLKHLSKNYLDMTDRIDTRNEHTGKDGVALNFNDLIVKLEEKKREKEGKKK